MRPIVKGSVDQSIIVRIIDGSSGLPSTTVDYSTSGLQLWYRREGNAVVDFGAAQLTTTYSSHTDGGFIHVNTGYYRVDLPDSAVAAGANGVLVGASVPSMVVIGDYVSLVDFDVYSSQTIGSGSVIVNHNFGGTDELAYKTGAGAGIDNAAIDVYLKSDYDVGNTARSFIVASSTTTVGGRWTNSVMLDPTDYTLVFYAQGRYGPDVVNITVT